MKVHLNILRALCRELNGTFAYSKIKLSGVKKSAMLEAFSVVVEKAYRSAQDKQQLSIAVINFYNDVYADDMVVAKPKWKRARKQKRARKVKTEGVVGIACKMIKDNPNTTGVEILDELVKIFPDRPREGMRTTVAHCLSIARQFLHLFGIEVRR